MDIEIETVDAYKTYNHTLEVWLGNLISVEVKDIEDIIIIGGTKYCFYMR